jgi:LuxR family maltose regulon positive regulatory protein
MEPPPSPRRGRPERAFATPPDQPPVVAEGIAKIELARVAYQHDELDAAMDQLDQGIAACRRLPASQALADGLALLAWVRRASGDPAGAMAAMEEAVRVAQGTGGVRNTVEAQRARLPLAQGAVADALRWTRDHGLDHEDEPTSAREPEYLVLARVLVARGFAGEALGLLDRLEALADAQGRLGSLIELRAQALAILADAREALRPFTTGDGRLELPIRGHLSPPAARSATAGAPSCPAGADNAGGGERWRHRNPCPG